jgi:tetratricopeptide (TPR) repeat protein
MKIKMIPLRAFRPLLFISFLLSMAGCAAMEVKPPEKGEGVEKIASEKKPPAPLSDLQKQKKVEELRGRIKEYETKREFQRALYTWKAILVLQPDHPEARRMVSQLEEGLKAAVQEHLQLGMARYQKGEWEKSRKEFLLVLFLDSGQNEALTYLRRLSRLGSPPPVAAARKGAILETARIEPDYILHTLKEGESLSILAERYYGDKMKYPALAEFNDIVDVAKLRVGQTIKIPTLKGAESPVKVQEKSPGAAREEGKKSPPKEDTPKRPAKEVPPEQRVKLGKKLFQENKFTEAAAEFQEIIRTQPDHKEATNYMAKSQAITAGLNRGTSFYDGKEYESAYDEFHKVLSLKPDVVPAADRIVHLIPLLIEKARHILHEDQVPCEVIALTKKILQRAPNNREAQKLLDEAMELERGLELQCR